jgi:uncharacterized repeat protein (TIGR03803 family)
VGRFYPQTLIVGDNGNFFGLTSSGGQSTSVTGCGTVFQITSAGTESALHLFSLVTQGNVQQCAGASALISGADGMLYGTTTSDGDLYQGTLFSLSLDGVYTVLHTFGSTVGT